MPETILGQWISEAKSEIKESRRSFAALEKSFRDFKEIDFAQLRLDFEKFKVEIQTKNRIIWILVTVVLGASGSIIALISLLHKAKDLIP